MGNAGSVNNQQAQKKSDPTIPFDRLLGYMLPMYYTKLPLQPICIEKIQSSWKKVMTNNALGFQRLKKAEPIATVEATSMEFFGNRFLVRLIEVHPVCHAMITKSFAKLGTLFLNMFSFLVKEIENGEALVKQLTMVAHTHIKMGVRAIEFGIVGEVLFWALRLTLGPEDYCLVTHAAWTKFYSRALDVIVPVILRNEIEHGIEMQGFEVQRMMPIIATKELIRKSIERRD